MGSITRLSPALDRGLTKVQAEARLREGLDNRERAHVGKSTGRILRENLVTLFNILNLVLAILVLAVGSLRNALFMGVVFSNAVIGTFQEIRSKRAVEKLRLVAAPVAHVLRDGVEQSIAVEDVVLDDLMIFETGNQISADALVRDGEAEVDESLLTGESAPVKKRAGDALMSGSFIVSGRLIAQADRVGDDTYAASIAREAKKHTAPNSELMRSLNALIRVLSYIIIPLGALLFARQYFFSAEPNLSDSVVSTVAAMIGMIPEGLVLLTSVALAVGVVRLSKKNTLVQSLYSMEDLARVDVLCLDKTGTITSGRLRFEKMEVLAGSEEICARDLGALLHAVSGSDATSAALSPHFPSPSGKKTGRIIPFSSARKWSAAEIDGESVVMGALQFVLPDADAEVRERTEKLAAGAMRVLVLAKSARPLPEEGLPKALKPMALLALTDEIRAEAPETIQFFEREGVTVKVISGDDPVTVSAIAVRAGIANADQYVDASTLPDEAAVHKAALQYTVFGRVTPRQKREIIRALKAADHTIAMTGDGVNDIPALKEADCSIAMASGSDAARKVASLVLLDCNFQSMPEIVMEGRRVIGNIRRSASLFLTKTIFSFLLSFLSLITGAVYPFVPIQLTLFSTVSIGIPSFLLALEPSRARVEGKFFQSVLSKALPGGLVIALGAWVLSALGPKTGLTDSESGTVATLYLLTLGMVILLNTCRPFNMKRVGVMALSVLLIAGALLFFPAFFDLSWPPLSAYKLPSVVTAAAIPLYFGLNSLFSRIFIHTSLRKSLHP